MKNFRLLLLNLLFALICFNGCGEIIETDNNSELDTFMKNLAKATCPDVGLTYQSWSSDGMGEKELESYFQCYLNEDGWLDKREFYLFTETTECPNESCLFSTTYYKYYETFYDVCIHNWDYNANRISTSGTCSAFEYDQVLERARANNNG